MYMNARYYEPGVARFLTPDSYTGNPYNPNTQNVYSYTGGNPVNYVDPTGHIAIAITLGIGALLLLGGAAIIATSNPVEEPPPSIDLNLPSLKERLAFVYVTSSVLAYMARDAVFGSEETEQTETDDDTKKKLEDGTKMPTEDALDSAEDFLGPDYKDMGNGRYQSADGTRQVRMGDSDLRGHRGGDPHMNFEIWGPDPNRPGRMRIIDNIHIYLEDK